jgi:hypothetical protein
MRAFNRLDKMLFGACFAVVCSAPMAQAAMTRQTAENLVNSIRTDEIVDPWIIEYVSAFPARSRGQAAAEIKKRMNLDLLRQKMRQHVQDRLSQEEAEVLIKFYQDKATQQALSGLRLVELLLSGDIRNEVDRSIQATVQELSHPVERPR